MEDIRAGLGETTSDTHGCNQITPEIGITDTPVIDRRLGPNGAIYFVAMTKDSSGTYHQRLHALDITNGAELFGGPTEIQATYPGTGDDSQNGSSSSIPGSTPSVPDCWSMRQHLPHLYLALRQSALYRMDHRLQPPPSQQTSVLNLTPNGNEGSIWMTGAGLAADASGASTSSTPMGLSTPPSTRKDSPSTATTATPS